VESLYRVAHPRQHLAQLSVSFTQEDIEVIFKQVLFLGLGFLAQMVVNPTFLGSCGASSSPETCLLVKGGVVLGVWILLNVLAGGGDK